MSSTLYRVTVRERKGRSIDLEFVLATFDIERVFPETGFLARVLADSLLEDEILALWPDADRGNAWLFAGQWLLEHADEVIDEESIELHDEVDHPFVLPSIHQLIEELATPVKAHWETDPRAVLLQLQAAMTVEGERLEFDDDLDLYRAGSLKEVAEEVASARLERIARVEVRASLRFSVRNEKWIAHLAVDDRFDSTAYPTGAAP